MHFRSMLSSTLAVLLVSGAAALAAPGDSSTVQPHQTRNLGDIVRQLPGVFKTKPDETRVAQADTRVIQLEEQIRALNGRVEELNFQILQMQEQMRKIQEDNEFRMQELEKKAGLSNGAPNAATAGSDANKPADEQKTAATPPPDGSVPAGATTPGDTSLAEGDANSPPEGEGNPPRTFGTITVDKDGNVTSSSVDPPIDLLPDTSGQAKSNETVAALPRTDNPEELYRNSYQSILSGDYANAETGFRDHIQRFPSDGKAADSNYWLGEALLSQQKYREAAEVFLGAGKQYPKAKKAPDMLLKLGVSMIGLNQKDVGCATFKEVSKRYPNATEAMKQRVKQEQALAAC